jgi:RNA recognition motif-containing protein
VFVSNLPFTCNEEMLRNHFSDVDEIEEVRLIRDSNGKVKGFAYI